MTSIRSCALVASLSISALAVPSSADTVTVYDGTFLNSNWSLTSFQYGPFGGSGSATQSLSAGFDGAAREVQNSCGPSFSGAYNVSLYTAYTYHPSFGGPLTDLTFSMKSRYIDGLSAIGFAVEQGGRFYSVGDWVNTESWMVYQASSIAGGFTAMDGLGGVPDFSANGAPIRFGFYSGNGSAGGFGYSRTGVFDDFTVTFVPTPGTLALAGFGALALARRRR